MRVFILDGGTMTIDRSQLLWNVDCGVRLRFPVYSVLVEHDEGLYLFDTGYDLEHVRRVFPKEEPQQSEAQGIVQQLALCGFAPGDVSYVVNSHLHFDHVGGNRHFPGAKTVVAKSELRQAKVPIGRSWNRKFARTPGVEWRQLNLRSRASSDDVA